MYLTIAPRLQSQQRLGDGVYDNLLKSKEAWVVVECPGLQKLFVVSNVAKLARDCDALLKIAK